MADLQTGLDLLEGALDRLREAIGDLAGFYGESGIVDRAADLLEETDNLLAEAIDEFEQVKGQH